MVLNHLQTGKVFQFWSKPAAMYSLWLFGVRVIWGNYHFFRISFTTIHTYIYLVLFLYYRRHSWAIKKAKLATSATIEPEPVIFTCGRNDQIEIKGYESSREPNILALRPPQVFWYIRSVRIPVTIELRYHPTWGSSEHHRLKSAGFKGDMLVHRRVDNKVRDQAPSFQR